MGFIKWCLWTSFAIGFGIFLATYRVEGRTPYDYMQAIWGAHAPKQVKLDSVKDALNGAKSTVQSELEKQNRPRERHTPEDRDSVNKLIAKKASGS